LPPCGGDDTFYRVRIGENTEALEITMSLLGNRGIIHPALLWDDRDGATLVDAGMPGQLADIEGKLAELGLKLTDIRRILLTHQDLDHIGSAGDIARATGAEVYAHDADVPYIQGERPLPKLDMSRIESRLSALPGSSRTGCARSFLRRRGSGLIAS